MRHLLKKIIYLVITFSLCLSLAARANEQNHELIREVVEEFVQESLETSEDEQLTIEVGRIDKRLKLAACQNKPVASLPGAKHRRKISLVAVRCEQGANWKIHVPVKTRILSLVAVSKYPIVRNSIISLEDIVFKRLDSQTLYQGYYLNANALVGLKAKRYIPAGQAFKPNALTVADLIKKGQSVIISAKTNKLNVLAKGTAMAKGKKGDVIKVRNRTSQSIIEGIIIGPGKVEVFL